MLVLSVSNKKLAAIGAWPPVCHRNNTAAVMLERRVKFILQVATPDTLPTLACPGWIPALHHEIANIAVKKSVVVCARRSQCQKILAAERDDGKKVEG